MGKEMRMATLQTVPATPRSALFTAALMSKVSKKYGAVQALKNFDLEVRAGQLTAVLGPNGAGLKEKS
jgi:D-xylose transport system ATP-binding protein